MKRPPAFWIIVVLFAISLVTLVMGQMMAVINYDFAVRLGLQGRVEDITEIGVQVNRGFGFGDTVVFVPLTAASLAGLLLRKRWALWTTAATMAVTAYVGSTCIAMLVFLQGTPGFRWAPGIEVWGALGTHFVFAVWGFFYVIFRGERLL